MKLILSIIAISFLLGSTCKKAQEKLSIPSCIQKKIDEIKAQPKWNPPAEINEYIYQDKHVYLFSSNCCDQYNMLYDENCNPICAPSGGFTGRGDGKCTDFNEKAKKLRLVWKDER
jgi:hypothetical protein